MKRREFLQLVAAAVVAPSLPDPVKPVEMVKWRKWEPVPRASLAPLPGGVPLKGWKMYFAHRVIDMDATWTLPCLDRTE